MKATHCLVLLRIAALLALGVSVALLSDYTSAQPAFCGVGSGCGAVRESGFGYLPVPGLGLLPVPVLGIVAFGGLYAATLQRRWELRARMVVPLAYAMGLGGFAFIVFQAFLGHFCSLCVTVDLIALWCAFCAFALSRRGFRESWEEEQADEEKQPKDFVFGLSTWLSLAALSVAGPAFYPKLVRVSEIPDSIRSLYEPGKVTVVEFFDYECPHCRDLSPRLKALVKQDGELAFRFGYTPLPGHQEAYDAARVTLCSAEQGKEWEVAALLFAASDLSLTTVTELAEAVVSSQDALGECLASRRPDQRIEEDTARLKKAGFEGLPTTYVGATKIAGARDNAVYLDAFRRAKDGSDQGGLDPWVYWAAFLAACSGVLLLGRANSSRKS